MEYFKSMQFSAIWMDIESIMLSEVGQREIVIQIMDYK